MTREEAFLITEKLRCMATLIWADPDRRACLERAYRSSSEDVLCYVTGVCVSETTDYMLELASQSAA